MNERNEQSGGDALEKALAALRSAASSDLPPASVTASTIELLQKLDQDPGVVRIPERRRRMFTALRYGSLAAVLTIAISLWTIDRNAGVTFAQVIENVQKAKSVRFELKQKLGSQPELNSRMSLEGDKVRYEIQDAVIFVMDTRQKKGLELYVPVKVARELNATDEIPAKAFKDPIDRLRNLKEEIKDRVDRLPDEVLSGRPCQVYQVKGDSKKKKDDIWLVPDQFKLWVDAKTGLPVQILVKDDQTYLLYEKFEWDVVIPEQQFSLQIPPGYQVDKPVAAVIQPNRIYYDQGWIALYSMQPDGQKPEEQFVPRLINSPDTYVADKSELSPDGRYLAIGYTHSTKQGSFPPYRVLLWDRTHPELDAVEIYARPEGELQSWQFSPDGKRLFVSWWEHIQGQPATDGKEGTDVVDIATRAKTTLKLPTFKNVQGQEQEMRFGAASADGSTFLVVGQGLHTATSNGQIVRRLSPADARIFPSSVRLSPDGKQALYVTQEVDQSQRLWVVPLAEGSPHEFIPSGTLTNIRARWSPDGQRIAYSSRQFDKANGPFFHGKETHLNIVDAAGQNVVRLRVENVGLKGSSLQLTAWR